MTIFRTFLFHCSKDMTRKNVSRTLLELINFHPGNPQIFFVIYYELSFLNEEIFSFLHLSL